MTAILILGKDGQLGRALARTAPVSFSAWGRATCDVTDSEYLLSLLDEERPRVLVNAAAYTNVDGAEREAGLAFRVNAELPRVLAHWALKNKAHLIHLSTDYVFDGTKGSPYCETDIPAPLNIYGESKLAGEDYVRASGAASTILRTSCLFDEEGTNFYTKILKQAKEGGSNAAIPVVTDITGSPTRADDLARAIWSITTGLHIPRGLFHVAGTSPLSRHAWAKKIIADAGHEAEIVPVSYIHTEGTAVRPRNTSLSSHLIHEKCGILLNTY